MKIIFYLFTLGILFQNTCYSQNLHIDSSEDEKKVKEAVVAWADSTFLMHKEWKFENFHAFYTEEYEIAYLRTNARKEMLADLEADFANGRYKKSDEDYQKEHQHLEEDYKNLKAELDNIRIKVTYYKISFWSNIQTTDGITVYYEHIVKLDHNFKVTEATINSAIGKKSEQTEIIYKREVKKKVDDKDPDEQKPGNGEVKLIVKSDSPLELTNPAPIDAPENETEKERKKRLKKEAKMKKKEQKENK